MTPHERVEAVTKVLDITLDQYETFIREVTDEVLEQVDEDTQQAISDLYLRLQSGKSQAYVQVIAICTDEMLNKIISLLSEQPV